MVSQIYWLVLGQRVYCGKIGQIFVQFLIESGFVRSEVDTCLFSRIVGDLMMVGSEQALIGSLTERFRWRFKEITVQEGKQVESRIIIVNS